MLSTGQARSIEDVAERVEQDRGYVARVLRLAFFSPTMTTSLLDRRQRPGLSPTEMLETETLFA